jgi:hypothetical protein
MSDNDTSKKLDVVIGLLLDIQSLFQNQSSSQIPEKYKMARLKQLGLENSEIGKMFGKSGDEVAKQLYKAKGSKLKRK